MIHDKGISMKKELDLRRLSESWIKMHLVEEDSPDYEENFWAYSELSDLCYDEPEVCFAAIEAIRSLDNSDIILSNLAAGPLENLLAQHGELFIGRIEEIADQDPKIRKLLGAVWKNSISDSIWNRIQKIADKSW